MVFKMTSAPRLMLLVSVAASMMMMDSILAAEGGTRNIPRDLAECEAQCKDPKFYDLQYFKGEDVLKSYGMLKRFEEARKAQKAKLVQDYGKEIYQDIFEPMRKVFDAKTNTTKEERHSVGRERYMVDPGTLPLFGRGDDKNVYPTFYPNNSSVSWTRLKRKFQIKFLQVRLSILEERENVKAICLDECAASAAGDEGQARRRRAAAKKTSGGLYNKFTWTTGGHSASAAHGDLHSESYTAVMGDDVKPIFASIGIDFKAKNYAMGGTPSGEEIALCMNSVFGRDVDFISWDYGMTDGHDIWKATVYAYKAAGLSNVHTSKTQPGGIEHRPALFIWHHNDVHNLVADQMKQLGMTVFAWNRVAFQDFLQPAIPDMMGKPDAEIAKLPKNVQYFKCEGKLESGEPGCNDNKFSHDICWPRKYAVSWHPGWRMHALDGHLMAVTLLDAAEDAIQDLIDLEREVPDNESAEEMKARFSKKLAEINNQEKKDYNNIFTSDIPEPLIPHLKRWWAGEREEHMTDLDFDTFLKEPSFCHTPLLPSELRYNGWFTNNHTYTDGYWDQIYEDGFHPAEIEALEHPNIHSDKVPEPFVDTRKGKEEEMLLVMDVLDRQKFTIGDVKDQPCPVNVNVDYKDYFHLSSVEGWRKLTVPNAWESKIYNEFDGKKSRGIILMCQNACFWGKCKEGDLHSYLGYERPQPRKNEVLPTEAEIKKRWGSAEVTVNGERVVEFSNMNKCLALKNTGGHYFKPNAEGRYEIRARIVPGEEYSYLRFSSIIIVQSKKLL